MAVRGVRSGALALAVAALGGFTLGKKPVTSAYPLAACTDLSTPTARTVPRQTPFDPQIMIGSHPFYCPCSARKLVGGTEGGKLVGGGEGGKLVGGSEGGKLVGGTEGGKLVGAAEGGKLVGAAEGGKLVGSSEGGKLVGAAEGGKLVGAAEGGKLVGGGEGGKLVGGSEGGKLVGGQTALQCQLQPNCGGFRLFGLADGSDVVVSVHGQTTHSPAACVVW